MTMRSINHLVKLAEQGRRGRTWYALAKRSIETVADRLDCPFDWLCDVIAITSPRISVRRNQRVAIAYALSNELDSSLIKSTHAAMDHYNATGEIRGPKTSAFAKNLKGDLSVVTLDVWMSVALGVDQREFNRKGTHAEATRRVKAVAKRLGWRPAEAQAAIWTAVVTQQGRNVPDFDITEELTLFD